MKKKIALTDEFWMARALDLARRGVGLAHPNPIVGAVIVKSGRLVGEGFHVYERRDHAEIVALRQAGKLDQVKMLLLTNCTFDGIIYDVGRVMEECLAIKPDLVFLWDEAWFAFARFHPVYRPRTAMRAAAYPAEDPNTVPTAESVTGPFLYLLSERGRGIDGQFIDAQ